MKKFITVALMLALVTSTIFTASSSGLSNTINTATSKSFTMWHFNKDEGPKMVDSFNEKYPNINVNLVIIPDRDMQYQNKLSAAIKSGVGLPDIVFLE